MGVMKVEVSRFHGIAGKAVAATATFDIQMVIYSGLLSGMGLVMAYSNSVNGAASPLTVGSTFTRGLVWSALALMAFVVAAAVDYRWLKGFAWPLYFVNIGLLVLSLAVGSGAGGSARWISVAGLQFQFSELAKVLMAIVLAAFLAGREERITNLSTILGAGLLMIPPLVLVALQPDLGTALVFVAILAGTLFMAGASLRWLAVLGAAAVAAAPFAWTYLLRDYQKQRLISFLDPAADPQGSGYHVIQSTIAVGSGGLLGKGLTNSTQNQLNFLPVETTDFVFAVLAEELGFIGALVVLTLFALLLWRVLRAAWRSEELFGLAFGGAVASLILFQLFVNVGMVLGIMPVTGIPLPFITHGGASLISIGIGLGILESINLRQARSTF